MNYTGPERRKSVLTAPSPETVREKTEILESIKDGFYSVDNDWRLRYINQEAERLWNRKREEVLGKLLWDVIPQSTGSYSYQQHAAAMKDRRALHYECISPVLHRWIEVNIYPSPTGLSVYFRDISDRKRAEQMREIHAHQQMAIASLGRLALSGTEFPDLLQNAVKLVTDTLNVEFAAIFLELPEEKGHRLVAGMGWQEGLIGKTVVPSEIGSQIDYTLAMQVPVAVSDLNTEKRFHGPHLLIEHGVVSGISMIIRGRQKPFGVFSAHSRSKRTFTNEDGSFLRAMANTLGMVMERRDAEERAITLTHELESKIAERTRQLEEKKQELLQAMKLEAIARLAGGVAHDFNNLILGISGISEEMLLDPQLPSNYRDDLRQIMEATSRASKLTRQLLAFGRRQPAEPVIVNINTVVSGVESMLRRLIGEDIRLITQLDPSLGNIKADSSQLEQVILNLAINARDAMPRGGTITIETVHRVIKKGQISSPPGLKPGPYITLSVMDTGTGMDEQTRTRVFEPFFTTKSQGKGTGLGLAMVYGIVKQSGGHILLSSEVGQGTTFTIYLPEVTTVSNPERREVERTAPGGYETILVVEDESIVRRVVTRLLQQLGYHVLEAANPHEAQKIAKEEPHIQLLLSDIVMPGMSGKELAQQIMHDRPGIKVLLMSGYAPETLVEKGAIGPDIDFIEKAFTTHGLAHKVREVLDHQRSSNPSTQ